MRVECCPALERQDEVELVAAAPSPVAIISTPPTPPGPPPVPALTGRQKKQLTFKWGEPEESGGRVISEYELVMTPPPEGWQGPPPDGEGWVEVYRGSSRRFTATPLAPGTRYNARVRASNYEGTGPWGPPCAYFTSAGVPAAPAYLAPADVAEDSVTLQWEAPFDGGSEITSYELEMDDGRGGEFGLVHRALPGPSACRHTVLGLAAGLPYRFRVRAESAAGKGGWSQVLDVRTAATVPGPPGVPTKLGATQTSIAVAWAPPEGDGGSAVVAYEVEAQPKCRGAQRCLGDLGQDWLLVYQVGGRGRFKHFQAGKHEETTFCSWRGAPGAAAVHPSEMTARLHTRACARCPATAQGPDRSCTLGGLRAGCSFLVQVRAVNATGPGEPCVAAVVATSPDVPDTPPPPTLAERHRDRLTASWQPPEHDGGERVSSYRLESRCLGAVEGRAGGEAAADTAWEVAYVGPERQAELRDLAAGMRYQLRLSAHNAKGASPWSEMLEAETRPGLPEAPGAPEPAAAPGSASLQLRWCQPYGHGAPVSSYILQMCRAAELAEALKQAAAAAEEAAATAAADLAAAGAPPLEVAAGGPLPPGAPLPNQASAADAMAVAVAAAAVGAPVVPDAAADATFSTVYQGGQTSFEAKALDPDTEYTFRLRAANAVGASAWSAPATLRTAPAPPSAPHGLALGGSPGPGSIPLAWQPPGHDHGAAVSSYQVEVATVLRATRSLGSWHAVYTGPTTSCVVSWGRVAEAAAACCHAWLLPPAGPCSAAGAAMARF